ncbi:hypothetical protein AO498_13525 [Algoriphagus sanaruensis]|uniref:Uncharacterized protein n=1 Tax=Algoriphagus sanaruensis TaxID=1727163 RepID=A0A142EQQ7_9BACT|nr:hypothetical protein AO498_13525 [Algoriphagus sanaruensis]
MKTKSQSQRNGKDGLIINFYSGHYKDQPVNGTSIVPSLWYFFLDKKVPKKSRFKNAPTAQGRTLARF